ncbi:[Fe-Fe] hydrogenase large subunit C-terminal domain-containing protein [Ructibacterium gallinarum]|uniref:4Fe-4S dicluster domain-containing protein n=1 Tax=Ructibacterium gallinarum TaxID=2779355 RepID=A0A9D5RBG0_9FIRM|nr:[Fe-Fe] hydrogenase large subunit C-terminal domain-containing protein [Ructibacterium gallinarum]MBE5039988.1 4Fe-4S dicluster domain-containing protein [Ructibacterium gallinarum]
MEKEPYWHSVTLDRDTCKGCTNCLKQCPTQAIRIQNGKAKILKERCIDCGECIRVCPYHAKKAVTDGFERLEEYQYTVALVAPAFYGQFSRTEDCNLILTSLLQLGFDDVYEVARGAQEISAATREFLKSGELMKPAISSACPAVSRLIAVRFPNLINHIIPLRSPMELSAEAARKEAVEKTGLLPEEIGLFFISPCAAKATAVKDGLTVKKSEVDGVISIKDVYLRLAQKIGNIKEVKHLSCAGSLGALWATSGGEANATRAERRISVDGIHNVIKVLEDIEDDKLIDIDYVEALACPGGCVGGPLAAENNFVARSRIKRMSKSLPEEQGSIPDSIRRTWDEAPVYRPILKLNDDLGTAMQMAMKIEEILEHFPGLDCGSCGSPSCRALAEDIVRGYAQETDCIFVMRERLRELLRHVSENNIQLPPEVLKGWKRPSDRKEKPQKSEVQNHENKGNS